MKVLFITYPMAFHTQGGGEIQLLSYKKCLEKNGIQVDLFDPWNPNFLDYDLVHFFSVIGGSVHLCNFIKNLGIPLVITSSLWITEETKHLYPVDEIRHQLSLANIIIGNSDIECDNMSKVLDLPREKFKTVYNGVEDIFFEKVDGGIFRKHFNIYDDFILNVGNIEPRKNQLNLAKAMKSIPNKKLVLIGHIRDKEYGKKVFEELGEQLIYIEYLKNDDELLRSAFNACHVFCLPSTLETPGLAALEAFTQGSNIVITKEGSTKEYFEDDVTYVDCNSIQSIFDGLQNSKLNTNSINLKNWMTISTDIIKIYNNILEKNSFIKQFNYDNTTLYVFPVIDWFFRIQRPQQIAKGFLNSEYNLIYFKTVFILSESPGYVYEIIDNKILNITLFLNEEKNIYKDNLDEGNIQFLLKSISKLEKDFLINKKISIVDHPFWIHLSKKLSGNFTIYDCMDYHPGFGDDSAYLVELEEIAMTQSDLLVLTSSDLFERFSSKNKNSILVRNGCEFDFFNKKPENIYKSKYEKVIGYYGAISSWFDTEMLINLAKYFSNYEFLLVGSTYGCEKLEELEKFKNVTLIGEVEYTKLTEYLYSFDVAIMPFKINELTIATNPVKVYEYLSSAVSVVATKLPEIDFMGDVVYSAITVDDFIHQINNALIEPTTEQLNKRLNFAKSNDWQSRYEQIETKIDEIKSNLPKISIVLVTYNNLDFTKACLYSMEKYNNYSNYEIIVVDNLSQDGTREYLTEYEKNNNNFKAILHDCNSGFAAGNNIGIKESKGEFVILLNNDTFVTPNWIQNLIKHFENDNTIGMIGPRTNNIGNESRLEIHYEDINKMIDKSYDIYYDNVSKQYNIPILAFFCVAIKRDIIEKVGLLDEIFGIGMFEDDDYCLRVKKEGYKLICADDVFIHHHLGASFNKDPEWKEQLFQKNKAIYESRWGKWIPHEYRKNEN